VAGTSCHNLLGKSPQAFHHVQMCMYVYVCPLFKLSAPIYDSQAKNEKTKGSEWISNERANNRPTLNTQSALMYANNLLIPDGDPKRIQREFRLQCWGCV